MSTPQKPEGTASNITGEVSSRLASYVMGCWREAATYKSIEITNELLRCDRMRKGEYEPEVLKTILEIGGSDIYMMIPDIKARAAASWIKDVIASAGDRPYDLEPANNPELSPQISAMIADFVMVEAEPFLMEGQQVHPDAFRDRMEEVHDMLKLRLREESKQAAGRMSGLIEDQLKAGEFPDALDAFIDDFCTYPTAILKGPVVRKKKALGWSQDGQPVVTDSLVRQTYRVSPYDIYPSPNSKGPNDGYLIERHRLHAKELSEKMGLPGYNAGEIAAALAKYGRTGLKYNEQGDMQRATLENKAAYGFFTDQKIEVLEYWGSVSGQLLLEWGYRGVKPAQYYEVNLWLVGGHVIRAVLNPDPLGRRPYYIASWRKIADSFWGDSLMKILRDVTRMCNNAARALADNMGIASGPQVDVAVDRMPEGYNLTDIYPWKVHQTTSDRTGSNQPAIRFYQPDMHAEKLMNVYLTFSRQADEVSGVPNYIYGSSNVSGAGRTASGLGMLMDNAAKGIKAAIRNIDGAIGGVVYGIYVHNMLYHPDPYIKGDFKVVARGALGVLVKEQLRVSRAEFMDKTNNPTDMAIIGLEGRAYLLREAATQLEMDTDKIVPSTEVLRFRQREEQARIQAMAAQGLAPDGTPLPQPGQPGQPATPVAA